MRWLKVLAARFWLTLLFWHLTHAPRVARALRPVILVGAWWLSPRIRRATSLNAARIFGPATPPRERRAFGRRVLRNFFEAMSEFARNRGRSREELLARIESVQGTELFEQARAARKGAILVTAHLGPFETSVASVRAVEDRIHVVFQRDRDPLFERLRSEQRRRLEIIEAPIEDGPATWVRLRDALARNEVVLMQGDRTMLGQRGRSMTFLHGHLELPLGPVRLAALTGAPIIPTFAVFTRSGGVQIRVHEAFFVDSGGGRGLTLDEAVRRLATVLAEVIRQYPDQWLILDPAWDEDRRPT